jgi:diguanylate cyclase (GGDEF)-like protein
MADTGNKEGGVMPRDLPDHANLEHLRKQAKNLLRDFRQGKPTAVEQFRSLALADARRKLKLADAQHAVAREYGFEGWPKMKQHVDALVHASGAVEMPPSSTETDAQYGTLEIGRKQEMLPSSELPGEAGAGEGEQDDLLPLYRKKQFDTDLPKLLSESNEHSPLSLLFIDLDHFKQVNDRYGHTVGDEVLLGVASAVKFACGVKGRCYRWGGEELAVLLPNYTSDEAASLAERIRQIVSKLEFQNYPPRMTISAGVSCHPQTSPTNKRLVQDADNAMYQAKQKGRNQVCNAKSLAGAVFRRQAKTLDLEFGEVPVSARSSTLTETPKRGRRTIPDNFLLGTRNAWAALLEESWPEIGWSLSCIRNQPHSTMEDVRKALEPVKNNPHNSGLAASFYHESSEPAKTADIRKNRVQLGKLQAQIHHSQAKHEELERSCREAEHALKVASPSDEATIREETVLRLQRLRQIGDDLKTVQSEAEALDKKLRDQEAYVYRSELLNFLFCAKHAVNPRSLANALAGLPWMRWRQSFKRCTGMAFNAAMLYYRVFEVIAQIWSHLPSEGEKPPLEFFRTELLKRSRTSDYSRQFLRENWRDLKLSIEECWKSKQPPGSIPFVLTSIFLRTATRQKDAAERILADHEKL